MLSSGFTFVKNAVKLDYPVIDAIESVLPLVDEFIVNVRRKLDENLQRLPDDGTRALIQSIKSPKIRIIESTWNPQTVMGPMSMPNRQYRFAQLSRALGLLRTD